MRASSDEFNWLVTVNSQVESALVLNAVTFVMFVE